MDGESIRVVLLDLDGTLVDSVPDLARAANDMLGSLGRETVTQAQVRQWVGDGISKLVERILSLPADGGAPDPAVQTRAEHLFREAYAKHLSEYSRIYPGVKNTLDTLRARGLSLACVTNKDTALARRLLEQLGLLDYLDMTVGGDQVGRYKPDPALLRYAMQAFHVTPAQTLMVGDSIADVGAARAAGVPIVAVTYGYNRGGDIAEEKPDRVIDSFEQLTDLLACMA